MHCRRPTHCECNHTRRECQPGVGKECAPACVGPLGGVPAGESVRSRSGQRIQRGGRILLCRAPQRPFAEVEPVPDCSCSTEVGASQCSQRGYERDTGSARSNYDQFAGRFCASCAGIRDVAWARGSHHAHNRKPKRGCAGKDDRFSECEIRECRASAQRPSSECRCEGGDQSLLAFAGYAE